MCVAGLMSDALMGLGLLTLMALSMIATVAAAAVFWLVRSGRCPALAEFFGRGPDTSDPAKSNEP